MGKFLVIINGLVLTLDGFNNTGYINLVVKEGKLYDIDYDEKLKDESVVLNKYPGAEIFDANNKIIVPSFYNVNINSSYSLCRLFFRKSNYENLISNASLKSIDDYFKEEKNITDLYELLRQNYFKSFLNGEVFLNETSSYVYKALLDKFFDSGYVLFKDIYFTIYDSDVENYFIEKKRKYLKGLQDEEKINNYTLSNLKEFLSNGNNKIFLEVLQNAFSSDAIKNNFGRSLIKVIKDNEILNSNLILSNPIYINNDDIKLLFDNEVNVVFCPTDFLKLSQRNIEFEEYMKHGINIAIGTGLLGNDILSELKTFAALVNKNFYTFDSILKMATVNPSSMLGISNNPGCIEKGKDANLTFFELSDIRNTLNVPEIDSDRISEFIIENLSVKDISDVLVNGKFEVTNYSCKLCDDSSFIRKNEELIKKVYEIGKYYEFKDKFISPDAGDGKRMKKVLKDEKKTGSLRQIESFEESFELVSDEQMDNESDFRVIGTKDTEMIDLQENFKYQDEELLNTMSELESFDKGVKFIDEKEAPLETKGKQKDEKKISKKIEKVFGFDDVYENVEKSEDEVDDKKSQKSSEDMKKLYFDDYTIGGSEASNDKKDKEIKNDSNENKDKGVKFKKGKIKFGFSDDEEKD